ncbi:MAG: hypothetical protein V7K21_23740 [Nostoc sp.]
MAKPLEEKVSRLVDAGLSLFAIRQTYLTVLSRSFCNRLRGRSRTKIK